MQKWEYLRVIYQEDVKTQGVMATETHVPKIVLHDDNFQHIEYWGLEATHYLNNLGFHGWELVGVAVPPESAGWFGEILWFKRLLAE